MSFDDFLGELRRYFEADGLADEAARALYDRWRAIAGDPARVLGLRDLVRGATMEVAHGDAWFEELADRSAASNAELMRLVLATDASMTAAPPARPHCPRWVVGRWHLDAVAEDGRTFGAPPRGADWTLAADGTLTAAGEPGGGARWSVHEGPVPELVVRERRTARGRRWLVADHAADRLDLIPPGSTHCIWRWRRTGDA
jgi:hypothetical protein